MKFRDHSTSFFHAQIMIRRRRNKVEGLHVVGDVWCSDSDIIKKEALSFFKKLLLLRMLFKLQFYLLLMRCLFLWMLSNSSQKSPKKRLRKS